MQRGPRAPEIPALRERTSDHFPFRLNTGRVRDQWHSMTRTGLSPRLGAHLPEPFVEVNPVDARRAALRDGSFARVSTMHGAAVFRVQVTEGQRPGSLFVPIHWSDATASSARVGDLVAPNTDPFSGQPESKATPASIEPVEYAFHGLWIARREVQLARDHWWSRVAVEDGVGYLIATNDAPAKWREHAARSFAPGADIAEYVDERRGILRIAAFTHERLDACLFIGPEEAASHWDTVKSLLAAEAVDGHARRLLLSGRSADGVADGGPLVCACFGVGMTAIRNAIEAGAGDVNAIGAALQAGTNCGSCRPELKRIIAHEHRRIADPV